MFELMGNAAQKVGKGAFLTVGSDTPNVMTIGWAQWGIIWGRPIMTIFVRKSRHTYGLLENTGRFTVSIPKEGDLAKELLYCGTVSGRKEDKLKTQGLTLLPSKVEGGVPGIAGCQEYFECKVVFKAESDLSLMDEEILKKFYGANQALPNGDPHTIYFAEVLSSYKI